jgi:phage tail sheath protein FI
MAYGRPGVYISERLLPAPLPQGVTADAAGAIVAPLAQGPESVTLVSSWYDFVKTFGGYNAAFPSTFGVGLFFQNGGRELYVKRLLASDAEAASVDILDSADDVVATVTAKNRGDDGNNLRIVVTNGTIAGTYTLTVYKEGLPNTASSIADDVLLERYENIVFDDSVSTDFAETVVNLVSPTIQISNSAAGTPLPSIFPLTGGDNGSAVALTDYTEYTVSDEPVFAEFSELNRPLVVFLPGIFDTLTSSSVDDVYNAAISWAVQNNGFIVVETAANQTVAQAQAFALSLNDSSHAAVYYPHTFIADPVGRGAGALRKVGPSGAVAGLYMNTDATIGVFKAPAGIRTALQGVVAVERGFTSTELDAMNIGSAPVNPIRQIPGAGLSVMGARTLLQDGTANRYVNMRRSLIYLNKQLKNLTEFAIFENNDERLWAQIRSTLTVFLEGYRGQGGLRGSTPAQAYYVKCDAENNPFNQIQNGEVHIQVGVALQYPAEFVVIDLSQTTGLG